VQFLWDVSSPPPRVRILCIRPWTASLAPLRAVLRDAGIAAVITRIDIEPALEAALARGARFDVIVHDPSTPGMPRELVDARLREHRLTLPVVPFHTLDAVVAAIAQVAQSLLN
jgi:hypothetical protein